MNKVNFTISGNPMGKQRARTLKTGRSYTPIETVNYETLVKLSYDQLEENCYFTEQVWASISAYYPIPKSTSKVKTEQMIKGIIRPTKKPDWDNIGKIICDSLNGVAYRDDSQVVDCWVRKFYGEIPRVEVEVRNYE